MVAIEGSDEVQSTSAETLKVLPSDNNAVAVAPPGCPTTNSIGALTVRLVICTGPQSVPVTHMDLPQSSHAGQLAMHTHLPPGHTSVLQMPLIGPGSPGHGCTSNAPAPLLVKVRIRSPKRLIVPSRNTTKSPDGSWISCTCTPLSEYVELVRTDPHPTSITSCVSPPPITMGTWMDARLPLSTLVMSSV